MLRNRFYVTKTKDRVALHLAKLKREGRMNARATKDPTDAAEPAPDVKTAPAPAGADTAEGKPHDD